MAFPQIISVTKGTDGSDVTSHTATYPSGIFCEEVLWFNPNRPAPAKNRSIG